MYFNLYQKIVVEINYFVAVVVMVITFKSAGTSGKVMVATSGLVTIFEIG